MASSVTTGTLDTLSGPDFLTSVLAQLMTSLWLTEERNILDPSRFARDDNRMMSAGLRSRVFCEFKVERK